MLFFLKKLISAFLLPLPIALALIIIGLFLLLSQCFKPGLWFIISGTLILLVFSFNPVPMLLLRNLESHYPPLVSPPARINTIVVLGGGVRGKSDFSPSQQLSSASLARLIEGIRLFKQLNPSSKNTLMLSGGPVLSNPSSAKIMREMAIKMGINAHQIQLETISKDTYQEALGLQPILKNKKFILVTSATHMPRAMAIFQKQGLHPIAAPTQFLNESNRRNIKNYAPNSADLLDADIALHEYIGMLWGKIRGIL